LKAIFTFFFRKTTPYGKILQYSVPKVVQQKIGKTVHYSHDRKKMLAPQTVATAQITPKVCQGQPPTFGSQCSKFHPNRFTFGGVIAERVKVVLLAHRVFPTFAQSEE